MLREIYARKALSQIPRLLGNQDRNAFSPTYGCFHRDYWLDKTSDFPDAVRQFAVHALALVYKYKIPGNIYYRNKKIRDWAIAGLEFWAEIQHSDGSFDEFYPYERGWVGPTAFTTYTTIETLGLLRDEIADTTRERVAKAIRNAAYFIAAGESEEDHLANHHAMACLAVWKAYELLGLNELKEGYETLWRGFLNYHTQEGWSIEYDGIDPGYLSATVSFLAKIYQKNPTEEMLEVIRQSVEICSYFVYPNGFYAGSIGSRNTLHFYPHGFEIVSEKMPLAGAIADSMLQALSEGKLVPPDVISDRYVVYRVPEFLLAYVDYAPRPSSLPKLPHERPPFAVFLPMSKIHIRNERIYYAVANLAKGGVIKIFDKSNENGRIALNDCGWLGRLPDGRVFTSQWIDPGLQIINNNSSFEVKGVCHWVPSHKVFTLTKNLIFRTILLLTGWSPRISHFIKGRIRKMLMLGQRPAPIAFRRAVFFREKTVEIEDEIVLKGPLTIAKLSLGDEFFVRYVPQSRYFMSQELDITGKYFTDKEVQKLNSEREIKVVRSLDLNIKNSADYQSLDEGT